MFCPYITDESTPLAAPVSAAAKAVLTITSVAVLHATAPKILLPAQSATPPAARPIPTPIAKLFHEPPLTRVPIALPNRDEPFLFTVSVVKELNQCQFFWKVQINSSPKKYLLINIMLKFDITLLHHNT
jgi:hypothetical protein